MSVLCAFILPSDSFIYSVFTEHLRCGRSQVATCHYLPVRGTAYVFVEVMNKFF